MCMYVHVRVGHTHTKGVCMCARAFVCMCARVCVHTPTNTQQTYTSTVSERHQRTKDTLHSFTGVFQGQFSLQQQ